MRASFGVADGPTLLSFLIVKVFCFFFSKKKVFFFEPLLWRAPPTNPRAEKQKLLTLWCGVADAGCLCCQQWGVGRRDGARSGIDRF
jgi:hypothetical protein